MKDTVIIGFIGDGQLAKMSAEKAIELGFECHFFGNNPNGPCRDLGKFFIGQLDDKTALLNFAKQVSILTLENEFVDSEFLFECEKVTPLYPSAYSFSLIENKIKERQLFDKLDIPQGFYKTINSIEMLDDYNFPYVLKASKGGYDGFGSKVIYSTEEARDFYKSCHSDVLLEEYIPFDKEVAITFARNAKGEFIIYPIADTIQEDQICVEVQAPADINPDVKNKIEKFVKVFADGIDAIGVFSIEFFIKGNNIYINETAPRPHNSAHYTMDGCYTSQFENHIRAITGMNLGKGELKVKKISMKNIIGQSKPISTNENEFIHWYNKEEVRPGRKMGHINTVIEV